MALEIILAILLVVAVVWFAKRSQSEKNSIEKSEQSSASENLAVTSLLDATLTGMREGLLVVNRDMRVVASNPAARKLFNPSVPTLQSQRLTELTRNPAIYSAFLDGLKGLERSGVKVETHGPERQIFDLRVVPIGNANGNGAEGALGVFFDITRLERLELVRQEFLSNVSHELRTPLTAIIAFVETLEDGAMDEPENARRFLSAVRRNAERMRDLINDILELSAIEAGMVPVEPRQVRLSPLVGECFTAVASRAADRGVSLRCEVGADVFVHADARRLEQMLTNLVDNAVKFNREGGEVR